MYNDFEEPYDPLVAAYEDAMLEGDYERALALTIGAGQVAYDGAARAGFAEGVRAAQQAQAQFAQLQQPAQIDPEQEAAKAEAYQNFLAETERANAPEPPGKRTAKGIVSAAKEDSIKLEHALKGLRGGAGARELGQS